MSMQVQQDPAQAVPSGPHVGFQVVHRRYVPYSHAHYAGNLVDGAYVVALFGDVATELMIRTDGDEGLFASYSDIEFRSALRGGDVVEVTATLARAGRRSREIEFAAHVVCRGSPGRGANAAEVLAEPLLITTARGTVVVPG
jgi:3-aminobutyryl-CoA ammonia-lyase